MGKEHRTRRIGMVKGGEGWRETIVRSEKRVRGRGGERRGGGRRAEGLFMGDATVGGVGGG